MEPVTNTTIRFLDRLSNKYIGVDLFAGTVKLLNKRNVKNINDSFDSLYFYGNNGKKYIEERMNMSYHLGFIIITTLNCNLKCIYCYEKKFGDSKFLHMNKSIAKDIPKFIVNIVKKVNAKMVTIIFSGGEPLLNVAVIEKISEMTNTLLKKENVFFKFSIVTNGTVKIDSKLLKRFINNGLNVIQISLDGPMSIHNKRRLSSFNAYERTLKFIEIISTQSVFVIIRVNIDKENINYVSDLLKELNHIKRNNLALQFYLTEDPICNHSTCNIEKYTLLDEMYVLKSTIDARQMGFKVVESSKLRSKCMNTVPTNFVINPEGLLLKCGGMASNSKEAIGNIYTKDILKISRDYVRSMLKEDCFNCKLLPFCMGGCKYNRYESYNECTEDYKIKKFNELYLKVEYIINRCLSDG